MGDSAFPNDEKILQRTDGVSVKSIPFEGILTDRRIILVDRARNVLPQKDIPLDTVRQVVAGENALGDPTITCYVTGNNNETRQMVLTFTRESGGNRARVRDEWTRYLEYYIPQARPMPGGSAPVITPQKKRILENPPFEEPAREAPAAALPETLFCIRCGNKVVSDSAFCNRCGAPIVPPAASPYAAASPNVYSAPPQPPVTAPTLDAIRIAPQEMPVRPPVRQPVVSAEAGPIPSPRKLPEADPSKKPRKQGFFARLLAPKPRPANRRGGSPPAAAPKPEKPRRSSGSGKKIILGVVVLVVILVVIAAGVLVVYPMISQGSAATPAGSTSGGSSSATPVPTATTSSGSSSSVSATWTPKAIETTQAAVPQTGVQVHVSYLGGFKGTYGLKSDLQTVKSSGDRVYEVLNATGAIQANFEKTDSSTRHDLLVEIYKNGKLLTSGSTSASYGKVALEADVTTGVAKAPITSASPAGASTTSAANTTVKTTTKTTTSATAKVT